MDAPSTEACIMFLCNQLLDLHGQDDAGSSPTSPKGSLQVLHRKLLVEAARAFKIFFERGHVDAARAARAAVEICAIALALESVFATSTTLIDPKSSATTERQPYCIHLDLLGSCAVTVHGRPAVFRGPKQEELLLLIVVLGGEVSRERAADDLWPESEGDKALTDLRTTLFRLRGTLQHIDGPHAHCLHAGGHLGALISCVGRTLKLGTDFVHSDVQVFKDHAHQALAKVASSPGSKEHAARALELYRGPLLPGRDEGWVRRERTGLASLANRLRALLETEA